MWLSTFILYTAAAIGAALELTTFTDKPSATTTEEAVAPMMDDECAADAPDGACGISLRQLRAAGGGGAAVSAVPADAGADASEAPASREEASPPLANETADSDDEDAAQEEDEDPEEDDDDLGVPGGWGEAANYGDEVKQNMTLHGDYYNYHQWDRRRRRRRRYRQHHHSRNIYTLYHQTSPWAAALILKGGFRPGTEGWCGGGIYFAKTAAATETKAIGPNSHKGAMLQVGVDVGRIKYMSKACDRSLNGQKVKQSGYDSVSFNPGDGQEYIVYEKHRVVWVKRIK